MRFRKEKKAADEPVHIEIWGHFVSTHRFFRRIAVMCVILAGAGLAVGTYGVLYALHEPLVFALDGDGKSHALGRRQTLTEPKDVEVRYVAKRFLEKSLAFHSDTIEQDLADAYNLMTQDLAKEMDDDFSRYEAEKGLAFIAWVKSQQIASTLEVTELTAAKGSDGRFLVRVKGQIETVSLLTGSPLAPSAFRQLEAELTLVPTRRTELSPHGLLVAKSKTRFFKAPNRAEELEAKVHSEGRAP